MRRLPLLLAGLSFLAATPGPGVAARKVLAPTGFPGWQTHNVCFPFVLRDPATARWRMYYTGSATDQRSDSAWDTWVTGVATSRDLVLWKYPDDYEPVIVGRRFLEGDLVTHGGAAPTFDAIVASAAWVIRDGAGWRAWYTGWNGDVEQVHFRIGHATSPDGLRWTRRPGAAEQGATLGLGAPGEIDALAVAHPSVVKVGATYRLWYEAYDGTTWRIARAHSADGLGWTKDGTVLSPGGVDALDGLGARDPVVRKTRDGFELWYQGRSRSTPAFHVLRATSVDGAVWTKDAREVVLHHDPPLAGDERVHVGSVLAQPDGSLLVFFARETASPRAASWGTVIDRSTAIYSETVRR